MSEQEFLNTDKSNLALQTQYFADSLKNFNDIAVHSKMMLELIAKRVLGQPNVISTVYGTDGDYSPPVDEIVAVRVMQLTSQTTPVVITLNGLIPVMVSTTPTQIVTGPISSVSVKNIVAGNPVYVQFLDERAALMNNETSQDSVVVNGTVGLTGRLVGLPQPTAVTVFSIPYSALTASTTYSAMAQKSLTRAVRQRTFYWTNDTNQPMSSASIKIVDSEFAGGSSNPGYWTEVPFTAIPGAGTYGPYPAIADSLSLPALGVMGDSVIVSFAVGATLPTSGSIVIAVLEG